MNVEIKKCADANDIKGLRYIFVDCLDVDPTFETYKDDYNFCKKLDGFFENHKEIKVFENNSEKWNEDYWVKLKVDLLKNFSEKRFEHMLEVVKVVKKEKIRRLEDERKQKEIVVKEKENLISNKIENKENVNMSNLTGENIDKKGIEQRRKEIEKDNQLIKDKKREEEKRIEQLKKEIEEDNQLIEYKRREEEKRIEQRRKEIEKDNQLIKGKYKKEEKKNETKVKNSEEVNKNNEVIKKSKGIVALVVIVIIAVTILIMKTVR